MNEKPFVHISEVEGVQHCHGDNCDEYYYRPLAYGKDIFMYIAHIPPGGGVPGDEEEASLYELALYILTGTPEVTYGDSTFSMPPHTAMHCERGVPIGFHNPGDEPVSLILSFSPAPGGPRNAAEMRALVEDRGRSIFSPAEMNRMAGEFWNSP